MNYFYNILNNNEENLLKENFGPKKARRGAKNISRKTKKNIPHNHRKKKNNKLKKEYQILEQKYLVNEQNNSNLEKVNKTLKRRNTRLERRLLNLRNKENNLESTIVDQEGKILTLNNQINVDQKKLKEIPLLEKDIKNQDNEIGDLNKKILKEKRHIHKLKRRLFDKRNKIDELESELDIQDEDISNLKNKISIKNTTISQANNLTNKYKKEMNDTNNENEKLKDYIQEYNIKTNPKSEDFFKKYDIETFSNPKIRINGKDFYKCQKDDQGNDYKHCINNLNVINNGIPSIYQNTNPPLNNKLYLNHFTHKQKNKIVSPLCPSNHDLDLFSGKYQLCKDLNKDIYCIPYDYKSILGKSVYQYLKDYGLEDCEYGDDVNSMLIKNGKNSMVFKDELQCKKWCIDNPQCLAISITKDDSGIERCNLYKYVTTNDGSGGYGPKHEIL